MWLARVLTGDSLSNPFFESFRKALTLRAELLRHPVLLIDSKPLSAPLQRSRDVERDDTLAAQLRQLPPGTARVWVRGAEVRAALVATAQPAVQERRRSQRCDKNKLVVLD